MEVNVEHTVHMTLGHLAGPNFEYCIHTDGQSFYFSRIGFISDDYEGWVLNGAERATAQEAIADAEAHAASSGE